MEISWAEPHNNEEEPDNVDTTPTMSGVLLVQVHQEGGQHDEEDVGDGVDELCNMWGEVIILFTPVNRTGPWL